MSLYPTAPIAAIWIVVLSGIVMYRCFLNRLKKVDERRFRDLGEPSLLDRTKKSQPGVLRFIRKREYRFLGDARLTLLGDLILVDQLLGLPATLWLFWPFVSNWFHR